LQKKKFPKYFFFNFDRLMENGQKGKVPSWAIIFRLLNRVLLDEVPEVTTVRRAALLAFPSVMFWNDKLVRLILPTFTM
jgi:hypothetical protein